VPRKILISAGEASGDLYAASLTRKLRQRWPDADFYGCTGPRMREAGVKTVVDAASLAVVGLVEVVAHIPRIYGEYRKLVAAARADPPHLAILTDSPDFHLRLARRLKAAGIPIVYLVAPQVWAWRQGRLGQMRRLIDELLCIFPFEAELYNLSGLRTIFVGHPMIENLAKRRTGEAPDPNLIGLFPGSRSREVKKIFPVMLKTIAEISAQRPEIRFEVAAASESLAREIQDLLVRSPLREKGRVVIGDSSGTMQRGFAGMVASGTATLEAAYFRLPFVLVYKVSWPTYFAARLLMRVPFLGMPNVLAGHEIVPEFLQHEAKPTAIAPSVLQLLNDPAKREQMIGEFDAVIEKLGESGASARAARAVLAEL